MEVESEPISLDELAKAFAQAMGKSPKEGATDGSSPNAAAVATQPDGAHRAQSGEATESLDEATEDAGPVTPLGILEAMLFVGDRANTALTADRAAELMRGVEPGEIAGLVRDLNRRYTQNECPYFVSEDADGYRIVLRKSFHSLRDRFLGRIREARLSQTAIDILAIVAYQQPLTAETINTVRGKSSSQVLSQLVHRGLLRIERPGTREPGRGKRKTAQYYTTDRFLRLFGLETLADLPQSEELDRQ
jgi:segregation and condensation protein B